jgi:6-phosphofructokinase 2
MEKIVTITTNAAIDKSTVIDSIAPEKKLRCSQPKFEPGGGGINVSRAIKKLGGNSTALFLCGGHTGNFFQQLIKQEEIDAIAIPFNGYTRENLIVLDSSTNQQYRFGMPGGILQEHEWRAVLDELRKSNGYEYAVISGSNARGVPLTFYDELAQIVKEKNAKLVVDTSEEALEHALQCGVYLVKPNLGELSTLCGVAELDSTNVVEAARSIINKGGCEIMVVSMGAAGAMLITATEYVHVAAPAVKRKSTVGAGDSMVAGILVALSKGWPLKNVLQYGVACGTAATINDGTALCNITDVERIYNFMQ